MTANTIPASILFTWLFNRTGGNLWIALMLTMVASLILGMGLTTTAVYITLAALVAHHLLTLGVGFGMHVGTAERIFVFVLLYGVGVDYSLLYLSRFREFLQAGGDPLAAAAEALRATAPAIGASAGTDIAGLAMLSAAQFKIFQTTGKAVPVALLVALAAALTLVPATAAIAHRRLFWPGRKMGLIGEGRLWPRLAGVVTRRPGLVLAAAGAVLIVPAVRAVRMEFVYDTLTALTEQYDSVRGAGMVRRHWPPGRRADDCL